MEVGEGKMKRGEGRVVEGEEVMEGMIESGKERRKEVGKVEGVSEEEGEEMGGMVGLGGLKYLMLKVDGGKKMSLKGKECIELKGKRGGLMEYR